MQDTLDWLSSKIKKVVDSCVSFVKEHPYYTVYFTSLSLLSIFVTIKYRRDKRKKKKYLFHIPNLKASLKDRTEDMEVENTKEDEKKNENEKIK